MAHGNCLKSRVILWRAVVLLIIVLLLSGITEAKIGSEDLKEISETLEITNFPLFSNYSEKQLKEILNKAIKPKEHKITYGILIQSAFNELEFMDMVLSQGYKDEGREYFNSILDKKLSLFESWKGTGKELYDVWKLSEAASPTRSLLMEIAPITQKTVEIFIALHALRDMKKYDGLWYYFDLRKQGNEPHEIAWGEAKMVMNWAVKEKINQNNLFRRPKEQRAEDELEQQFVSLYDKWGEHAMPYGISKKYKERLAEELRDTLAVALESHTFVEETPLWEKIAKQLNDIKKGVAVLIKQVNPFSAGPVIEVPAPPAPEPEVAEARPPQYELMPESEPIEEFVDVGDQQVAEDGPPLIEEPPPAPPAAETTLELAPVPAPTPEAAPTPAPADETLPDPVSLCEKEAGQRPTRFRVLINEVVWMGNQDSASNEWIELKNIWGISVELDGWQLQDKDQKIAIIFGREDIIPAQGYYLLERTDDDSLLEVPADKIYTGALNNTNEALYLFDAECNLEDEVIADPNWPAGDNTDKRTMERFGVSEWYTSYQNLGSGTPGQENSSPPAVYIHPSAPTVLTSASIEEKTPKILITEIQIEDAESSGSDFIKLYNPNDNTADISNWQIKKKSSTGKEYSVRVFSRGSAIAAKGYFIWANYGTADATSTQTLAKNNSIALFDKKKNIIDQVAWGTSVNPFVEDQAFLDNPDDQQNLKRKWSTTSQSYIDTDNNSEDFELQGSESQSPSETASLQAVINEIAWAGNKTNSADEWIELYNNTTSTIDMTGWTLKSIDGTPSIVFSSSSISAQGYFLLERTDDNTVSDIAADQIYTGALGNSGEKLELRDDNGNLVDSIDASEGWSAGQASPNYVSMERISSTSTNWASNNRVTKHGSINGTPKSENSVSKSSTKILGFAVNEDLTFTLLGSPYIVDGFISVAAGAELIFEPNVTMKFKMNSGINIEGNLSATSTTFTAFDETQYWDWLYFKENSKGNLENVVLSSGGRYHKSCCYEYPPYTKGAIMVEKGQITLKNSTIEKSYTRGLWLIDSLAAIDNVMFFNNSSEEYLSSAAIYIEGSSTSTVQNSTFQNNKIGIWASSFAKLTVEDSQFQNNETPIKIGSLLADFSGNIIQNNDLNGILITDLGFSDGISQIVWQKASLSYILESSIAVPAGKTLNIEPDVIVKLKGGGRIYIEGDLQANGSKNKEVVFTALADDEYGGDSNNDASSTSPVQGSWDYISFSASSTNSILDNVIVRYGGFYGMKGGVLTRWGVVKINNADIVIQDSLIENNKIGVELINGVCPNLSGIVFSNNEIDIYPASCNP